MRLKKITFSKTKLYVPLVCLAVSWLFLGLKSGAQAPSFSAVNQDGKTVRLTDFSGKYVLLYFYPKDDTPGCTQEASQLRDEFSTLTHLNTVVLGVSRQDQESHRSFKSKYKLPFDLLVDKDGSLAKQFGIDTFPVIGLHKRQSVLIGPSGKILRFFEDVKPETHAKEVIAEIKKNTKS